MIALSLYQGRKVGVFGLGKAGQAALASLIAGGAQVMAYDDNRASIEAAQAQFPAVQFHTPELWPWAELSALVLGPGVPFSHPTPHMTVALAKANNVEVLGELELLTRTQKEARYVGITGTNGKSTTTSLVAHILREAGVSMQVGGNLGVPALALEPLGKDGVYVLELSSYQLDLVKQARLQVAVFLNLTPDHLDRHGDMAGYHSAKLNIFANQEEGDVAVVAVDDEYSQKTAAMLAKKPVRLIRVSAEHTEEVYAKDGVLHAYGNTILLARVRALQGQHNWQNAVSAYAACHALGLTHAQIESGMLSFGGLAHRMEWITSSGRVSFINDSKATNADATQHALKAFETIFWILGGKPKEGGIASLAPLFGRIRHAYLIGAATEEFASALEGKVAVTRCNTLDVAVAKAASDASKENTPAVVLLSPACASFDQFKSFEERGDVFRALVHAWAASHAA